MNFSMWKIWLYLTILLVMAGNKTCFSHSYTMEDAFWSHKNGITQVDIIFSSKPSPYKSFTMDDKNFIVYDFIDTLYDPGKKNIDTPNDPVIREISLGQYQENIARVVLRLKEKVSFKVIVEEQKISLICDSSGKKTIAPEIKSPEIAEKKSNLPGTKEIKPAANEKKPATQGIKPPATKDILPTATIEKNKKEQESILKLGGKEKSKDDKGPEKVVAIPKKEEEKTKTQSENPKSSLIIPPVSMIHGQKKDEKTSDSTKKYIPIVVIDPGHGGNDPGAVLMGTQEKDIVLAIAKRLKEKLDATNKVKAFLTRTDDQLLTLEARTRIAKMYYADLFLSIHADSIADTKISGVGVYYLSDKGASSKAAAILAAKENAVSAIVADVSLSDNPMIFSILMDLEQTKTIKDSSVLAGHIEKAVTADPILTLHGVHQAGFVVLQSIDIPSVLIEVGFLSNNDERENLKKSTHQDRIAEAIKNACESFLFSYMLPSQRQTGKH